jgi:histidyl-tRNA synthetase
MNREYDALGIPTGLKGKLTGLVDKRNKMDAAEWDSAAFELGLSAKQLNGLTAVLADGDRWRKSDELVRLFSALDVLGAGEYVQYDPNITRGLLYYTGTVFEAFDVGGSVRRSILGGGRYDNLLRDVGGDPLPAVGFAMGDAVIGVILEELGLVPPLAAGPAAVLVTVFSPDLQPASLRLSAELRREGLNAACYPEPAKLPKQFKYADRMGMKAVLVLGPDEAAASKVTLKDLARGAQETVGLDQAPGAVRRILESG